MIHSMIFLQLYSIILLHICCPTGVQGCHAKIVIKWKICISVLSILTIIAFSVKSVIGFLIY